jgi:hypothetical protein
MPVFSLLLLYLVCLDLFICSLDYLFTYFHLHYKNQFVNAVKGNNFCLLWESYETHKYSVVKMQSYWLLNQAVHIVTAGFWKVETKSSKYEIRTAHMSSLCSEWRAARVGNRRQYDVFMNILPLPHLYVLQKMETGKMFISIHGS